MMDTGLLERLHYWLDPAGFQVVEIDGWQTRGRTYATYAPRGSLQHHTAGALAGGDAPSLGICINGRSDLPGPLCQVFGSRSLVAYVVAAGLANHAGGGGWNGLVGNASVGGMEMEHDGGPDEPRTERLMDFCARVQCALITAPGSPADPANSCQHFEWSNEGKIDFYKWPGDDLRQRVANLLVTGPGGAPPPAAATEDDMNSVTPDLIKTKDGHYHSIVVGLDGGLYHRESDGSKWLTPGYEPVGVRHYIGEVKILNSGDRIDLQGTIEDLSGPGGTPGPDHGQLVHLWRPVGGVDWGDELLNGQARIA